MLAPSPFASGFCFIYLAHLNDVVRGRRHNPGRRPVYLRLRTSQILSDMVGFVAFTGC